MFCYFFFSFLPFEDNISDYFKHVIFGKRNVTNVRHVNNALVINTIAWIAIRVLAVSIFIVPEK